MIRNEEAGPNHDLLGAGSDHRPTIHDQSRVDPVPGEGHYGLAEAASALTRSFVESALTVVNNKPEAD